MPQDNTPIIVAAIALIAAVIAPVISGFFTAQMASKERKEARRKAREEYWLNLGRELVELRAKLQYLQTFKENREEETEILYGKAFGIMLLSGDEDTRAIAEKVMSEPQGDPKLQPINQAIINFSRRAEQVMKEK